MQTAHHVIGVVRSRRVGVADCLRKSCESAAGAERGKGTRSRSADGAGGKPMEIDPPVAHGEHVAFLVWRRTGSAVCGCGAESVAGVYPRRSRRAPGSEPERLGTGIHGGRLLKRRSCVWVPACCARAAKQPGGRVKTKKKRHQRRRTSPHSQPDGTFGDWYGAYDLDG